MNIYKRIMIVLTAGILLIGLISFRFDAAPKNNNSGNTTNSTPTDQDGTVTDASPTEQPVTPTETITTAPTAVPVTSTPVPSEPAEPDNVLLREAYPDIHKLIENYLQAKLDCTLSAFENVVTDTRYVDLEQVAEETQSIRSYNDIVCYTKQGTNDIDMIVYCTYTMNIVQIDTPVPSIDAFYIQYNEAGVPKVFGGTLDQETANELEKHNEDEDVQLLITETNEAMRKALTEDEDLREFWDNLLNKVGEGEEMNN